MVDETSATVLRHNLVFLSPEMFETWDLPNGPFGPEVFDGCGLYMRISPTRVRYVKLGEGGSWERNCLERGTIRIGFGSAQSPRFELCQSGRWTEVAASFVAEGKDKGTATRSTNELHLFFEDATLLHNDRDFDVLARHTRLRIERHRVLRPVR